MSWPVYASRQRHVAASPIQVHELAYRSWQGAWQGYPEHAHDCVQVYMAFDAPLHLTFAGQSAALLPGQVAIIQPHVRRSVASAGGSQRHLRLRSFVR
jgi:hypothetical protein